MPLKLLLGITSTLLPFTAVHAIRNPLLYSRELQDLYPRFPPLDGTSNNRIPVRPFTDAEDIRGGNQEDTTDSNNAQVASDPLDDFRGGSNEKQPRKRGFRQPQNQPTQSQNNSPSQSAPAVSKKTTAAAPSKTTRKIRQDQLLIGTVAIIVIGSLFYKYRETLAPLLDKQQIQERTRKLLQDLEKHPGSIPIYILGMAAWELLGLSTIPVETAAAMVFGPVRGFLASGSGKMLGAYTAFGLGRGLLADWIRIKLSTNTVWAVLDKSTDVHSPLNVALRMKFSCFPEFIKNFGSACLEIPFPTFALATALHGLLFTCIWTMLGVDAAARLDQPGLPPNYKLQVALVLAAIVGLVGSPLLMAAWIREMTKMAEEVAAKEGAKK